MLVEDVALTIKWPIRSLTTNTVIQSLFNVVIIDPEGVATYYTATTGWVEPTSTVIGNVSYVFTPTVSGMWVAKLVTGVSTSYTELSECKLPVRSAISGAPTSITTTDVRALSTRVYAPVSAADY